MDGTVGTLKQKVKMKRINAEKEGLHFELTVEDIEKLLKDAGITAEDWTYHKYHLARVNDKGNYTPSNCRFITREQNIAERQVSEKWRESARRTVRIMNELNRNRTKEEKTRIGKLGGAASVASGKGAAQPQPKEFWIDRYEKVKHLDLNDKKSWHDGAKILGCSHVHFGRMMKKMDIIWTTGVNCGDRGFKSHLSDFTQDNG